MTNLLNKKPFFCNYWVTYRCNSKCRFCNFWQDSKLKNIPDANIEQVKKNLDDLKKIGVKFIDFTGGEPLLNKDLPEILSYAKSLGFFVKLSTNGFLYSNKANELKGLSSRIYFSFDTTSKNDYKEIRGIDGLNRLMESIKIAQENKENICLIYTATNENIKNISNIVDFAQKNKILLYIHPCFSYFNNESLNKKNIHILKKYFWKPYIRLSLPQLDFHKKGGNNPLKPTCRVGVSTIDIGPDSTLTVPCFHHYLKRKKIEGNLFSIYNSKEWNELYFDAGKYDFCKNCTIDCYFGMSYWDRMPKYFIKQNLTYLKNLIENNRSKK